MTDRKASESWPLLAQRELDLRAEKVARKKESQPRFFHALRLKVGKQSVLLPFENMLQIHSPAPVTHIPGRMPPVLGLMNLRSVTVPVLDLAELCGFDPVPLHAKETKVVLFGPREQSTGFLVSAAESAPKVPHNTKEEKAQDEWKGFAPLLDAVVRFEGESLPLLNTKRLLEKTEELLGGKAV